MDRNESAAKSGDNLDDLAEQAVGELLNVPADDTQSGTNGSSMGIDAEITGEISENGHETGEAVGDGADLGGETAKDEPEE